MLKCHPITTFMKTHANIKKIFLIRVFWFKCIFPIKSKIRILDLMLLPKNSVPFEGLHYSNSSLARNINAAKPLSASSICYIMLLLSQINFSKQSTSVDPDQTAPLGAV